MAVTITTTYTTGKTLTATLVRVSDGYRWSELAGAWEAAPTYANSKIALTEGTAENLKTYTGANTGNLGDAGRVTVRVHDEGDSNKAIASCNVYVIGGNEVTNVDAISGDTTAADNAELAFDGTGFGFTNCTMPTTTTVTNIVSANVTQISGDSTAADNAELAFDGTGFGFTNCTIPTVTTVTNQVTANVTGISGDATAADNLEALLDGTGGVTLVASAFTLTTPITANTTQISGDATAADNAEAFFDGTGYAGTNNVIPTVTTVTNRVTANTDQIDGSAGGATNLKYTMLAVKSGTVQTNGANTATTFDTNLPTENANYYGTSANGLVIAFIDSANDKYQTRKIVASVTSGGNTSITLDAALDAIPTDGDVFIVLGRG